VIDGQQRHAPRTLLPLPSRLASDLPISAEDAAYLAAFARFLHRNVASGGAAEDTLATYSVHVATWLAWCRGTGLELASATVDDVEDYREALIGAGCQPATVAIQADARPSLLRRRDPRRPAPRQPGRRRARAACQARRRGLRLPRRG